MRIWPRAGGGRCFSLELRPPYMYIATILPFASLCIKTQPKAAQTWRIRSRLSTTYLYMCLAPSSCSGLATCPSWAHHHYDLDPRSSDACLDCRQWCRAKLKCTHAVMESKKVCKVSIKDARIQVE